MPTCLWERALPAIPWEAAMPAIPWEAAPRKGDNACRRFRGRRPCRRFRGRRPCPRFRGRRPCRRFRGRRLPVKGTMHAGDNDVSAVWNCRAQGALLQNRFTGSGLPQDRAQGALQQDRAQGALLQVRLPQNRRQKTANGAQIRSNLVRVRLSRSPGFVRSRRGRSVTARVSS